MLFIAAYVGTTTVIAAACSGSGFMSHLRKLQEVWPLQSRGHVRSLRPSCSDSSSRPFCFANTLVGLVHSSASTRQPSNRSNGLAAGGVVALYCSYG